MSTEKFNDTSNPNTGFGGTNPSQGEDDLPGILMVASFCAPIVGLILWAMNKDQFPRKAKKAIMAGIAGFAFYFVINILVAFARIAIR